MNSSLTEDTHGVAHSPSMLMAWLKLLRLPTVFTSISNVACGYFITTDTRLFSEIASRLEFWLLVLTSSCLYLGGMVLNDAFDAELDAVERPERPIPSGAVCKTRAFAFGFLLIAAGIASAWFAAGNASLLVAIGIACSVILYDSILKNTKAAPLGMATCRFLNLILGCTAALPIGQAFTFSNPGSSRCHSAMCLCVRSHTVRNERSWQHVRQGPDDGRCDRRDGHCDSHPDGGSNAANHRFISRQRMPVNR